MAARAPDGLSAAALSKSLDGIPSTLQGMRSPLEQPSRSESVAGMDMLNDMFQRQARRLESQLYQRAQDQRTIEATQRASQLQAQQVHQLEQHHVEQAARISQGAKSLAKLQALIRDSLGSNHAALAAVDALEADVATLRDALASASADALAGLTLRSASGVPTAAELRRRAAELEAALASTEADATQQIGPTPLQSVAMSSDCNPLNDLSAVADYASKASVGAGSPAGSPHDGARAMEVEGAAAQQQAYAQLQAQQQLQMRQQAATCAQVQTQGQWAQTQAQWAPPAQSSPLAGLHVQCARAHEHSSAAGLPSPQQQLPLHPGHGHPQLAQQSSAAAQQQQAAAQRAEAMVRLQQQVEQHAQLSQLAALSALAQDQQRQ